MSSTLFGHIALHYASSAENFATEALGYVLRGSPVARDAMQVLLQHSGMPISGTLTYLNQVSGDDQAQPDIVGMDDGGEQRLVIEAKFWAGFTDHQPITYLKRLPKDGGVLLFIAPAARQDIVWGELLGRCEYAGIAGGCKEVGDPALRRFSMADGTHLALVSWHALLNYMMSRVEAAGDRKTLGDLEQLQGLCDAMDSTAFLPLTSEEITNAQRYKRVLQFSDLIDELVPALVGRGAADTTKLVAVSRKGIYGRYLRFQGYGAYLSCDIARSHPRRSGSPLDSPLRAAARKRWEALAPLASHSPPRVFIVDKDLPTVPLYVSSGLSKDEVKAEVLAQLDDIGLRLPPLPAGTMAKMGTGEGVA